jgi:hypothetical protein
MLERASRCALKSVRRHSHIRYMIETAPVCEATGPPHVQSSSTSTNSTTPPSCTTHFSHAHVIPPPPRVSNVCVRRCASFLVFVCWYMCDTSHTSSITQTHTLAHSHIHTDNTQPPSSPHTNAHTHAIYTRKQHQQVQR